MSDKFVSAYTADNKIVEGDLAEVKGRKVVLAESGKWYDVASLKCVKFLESEPDDDEIMATVNTDVESIKDHVKDLAGNDAELEKVADKREKELNMKDGTYAPKFINAVKAQAGMEDVENGDATASDALKAYQENIDFESFDDFYNSLYDGIPDGGDDETFEWGQHNEDDCEDFSFDDESDADWSSNLDEFDRDSEEPVKVDMSPDEDDEDILEKTTDAVELQDAENLNKIEGFIDDYSSSCKCFDPRECFGHICKQLDKPELVIIFDRPECGDLSSSVLSLMESIRK